MKEEEKEKKEDEDNQEKEQNIEKAQEKEELEKKDKNGEEQNIEKEELEKEDKNEEEQDIEHIQEKEDLENEEKQDIENIQEKEDLENEEKQDIKKIQERAKLKKEYKNNKKGRRWLGAAVGVLACFVVVYFAVEQYYSKRFFPNVTINGRNVSGMTVEQVKQKIWDEAQTYTLHIYTRGDVEETIKGADIDLRFQYGDLLTDVLNDQQAWKWGEHIFAHTAYTIPILTQYDEAELNRLISNLSCSDTKNMEAPKNAYLTYDDEEGLRIVPEEKGSRIVVKDLKDQIILAIQKAETEISLEELGLYIEAQITQENEELVAEYNKWKRQLDTKIVYHFDDAIETLDASVFKDWISVEEDGSIAFDHEKVKDYVRTIARRYNTAYNSKTLETSYGETVTVPAGPYGWLVNQAEEVEILEAALLNCESQDREPVYFQTAASHTGPDYGDTYVEINLSAQHLFFYKEGELLLESDFVSGNEAAGCATPAGVFPLTYKERNVTLRGPGYATPVSYWMPFNGDIGMHDSSWRNSYGKNIYKYNGSHGCINLPPNIAETIYENIEKGMPVLCYYLSGTEYTPLEPQFEQMPKRSEPENPEFPGNIIITPDDSTIPNNGIFPNDGIIPNEGIFPNDSILPNEGIFPNDNIIPNEGIFPNDNILPNEGIFPNDSILPNDGIFPNDSIIPNDGIFPNDSILPNEGIFPNDNILPNEGIFPNDSILPNEGIFPNDNIIPNDGIIPDNTNTVT